MRHWRATLGEKEGTSSGGPQRAEMGPAKAPGRQIRGWWEENGAVKQAASKAVASSTPEMLISLERMSVREAGRERRPGLRLRPSD